MLTAESGYAQTQKAIASPRQIERQILLRIAAEIEAAEPDTLEGYKALASAIERNNKLWFALLSDLADPDNEFPNDLRARLISIGTYCLRAGVAVLAKEEDRSTLVKINRTVAGGLGGRAQEAA